MKITIILKTWVNLTQSKLLILSLLKGYERVKKMRQKICQKTLVLVLLKIKDNDLLFTFIIKKEQILNNTKLYIVILLANAWIVSLINLSSNKIQLHN